MNIESIKKEAASRAIRKTLKRVSGVSGISISPGTPTMERAALVKELQIEIERLRQIETRFNRIRNAIRRFHENRSDQT